MSTLLVTSPTWETDTFSPGLRLVTSIPLSAPSLSLFLYPSYSPVRLPLKPEMYHSSATLLYFCWSLSLNPPHCSLFLSFYLSHSTCAFSSHSPWALSISLSRSLTLMKSLLRLSFSLRFIRTLEYLVSGLQRCSQLQSKWRGGSEEGQGFIFSQTFFLCTLYHKASWSLICMRTHTKNCLSDSSFIS